MNGRTETNYKIETSLKKSIQNEPVLIRQFVQFRLSTDQPKTVQDYCEHIVCFNKWLLENRNYELSPETVNQILPMDCSEYISSLRYRIKNGTRVECSVSYRCLCWSALNAFFKFCKANRILKSENPMDDVKRPKNTDPIPTDHLQPSEIKTIMRLLKEEGSLRDLCMLSILFQFGVRAQCLLNVNVEDVDLENRIITFTDKGDKTFSRPINPELALYLEEYIAKRKSKNGSHALFTSSKGTRMCYDNLRLLVNKYTKAIGHKLSPHAMRKSYASIVYKASGSDIRYTQKMLNHSNINTTTRYINEVNEEQDRKVSSILQNLM